VTGSLIGDRQRVATPQPSAPSAIVGAVATLVERITRRGTGAVPRDAPVGVGIPSIVVQGVCWLATHIDPGWVGYDAEHGLSRGLGRPVAALNDADAAGIAEMGFGAGVEQRGTVIVLTLGTGVGSGVFVDGKLVPNVELGQMEIRGRRAERRSAANARVRRGISWKAWAMDLDEHLEAINLLLSPSLFILGGGVSKNSDRFIPRLTVTVPVVPAKLRNQAGIVGAAIVAAERADPR
jgi:polyphosphate glucokinase